MDKFALDYNQLEKTLTAPKTYRLKDVEHRLEKVAFGTVRFMDSNDDIDGLWEIQNTDDGEVIIAKYDYEDPGMKTQSSWDVLPDIHGETMNIFYKGQPVVRIAAPEAGSELPNICKNASIRLEKDASFRDLLLDEMETKDKFELLNQFPELNQG
jgi:antitoxin (DNA-binding transcriptional repressor) of toxin-antitoxin stability system